MIDSDDLYTRAAITEMIGIEPTNFDYWLKLDLLHPSTGGGGRGQHRKFDKYQVSIAAFLQALHDLGLRGKNFQAFAAPFSSALDWFGKEGLLSNLPAAASLIENALDIEKNGFATVPDNPELPDEFGRLLENERRAISWEEVVTYHRQYLRGVSDFSDAFAERCRNVKFEDYLDWRDLMFVISPAKASQKYVRVMYLWMADGGFAHDFNEMPDDVPSFMAVNVALIKAKLWGWK